VRGTDVGRRRQQHNVDIAEQLPRNGLSVAFDVTDAGARPCKRNLGRADAMSEARDEVHRPGEDGGDVRVRVEVRRHRDTQMSPVVQLTRRRHSSTDRRRWLRRSHGGQ